MRKIAIRFVLATFFLLALTFLRPDFGGRFVALLTDSSWAVVFAVAVFKLTGRARMFVPVTVFLLTALLPFLVLCWIGLPSNGTWSASAGAVISSMRRHGLLWGIELLIPTLISAFLSWRLMREVA